MLALGGAAHAQPYELRFSGLLGGAKWERVQAVSVDAEGYVYVAGSTKSGDFPTTPGAYDRTGSGNDENDGFVAKIAPDGGRLVWSTYLQGSARDDVYGVSVDARGYVYAVGWTRSTDFPTTPGAYDRTHNGEQDVFLAKIAPDGGSLVFSTFLGGSGIDQCRGAMDFDESGPIYLSGYTDSLDFPTTGGAIQREFRGGYGDAFVAKVSSDGSQLLFSTYLGSSGPDHAFPGLRLHSDGSIVVSGVAGADDFPTTPGSYQAKFAGTEATGVWYGDTFVARFSLDADHRQVMQYSTFLGGTGKEVSTAQHGLALDAAGNAIVALTTYSKDFPTMPGAYQKEPKGSGCLAIAKISLDGSTLLAATYFGGAAEGGYEASGLELDSDGNVYVSGSIYGAVTDHPVTGDAFRKNPGGAGDAFLAVLSPDLSELRYSTYFGGAGDDRIRGLARTRDGDLIFGGDTYSTDLPLTAGAFQTRYAGAGDAYVARLSPASPARFQRGDANSDGGLDLSDAVFILSFLFRGGFIPPCEDATDSNDDGALDISDAVKVLLHLFAGAEPLPEPFAACGADPTGDEIGCAEHPPCS